IKKQLEKRDGKADQLKMVDGKPQWVKVDLIALAQDEKPAVNGPAPALAPQNLLQQHRDRQAIEEQKVTQLVDDTIRHAGRNWKIDPDGTLDHLRNLLHRVKDHGDLSAKVRDALVNRLQSSLRDSAAQIQAEKLRKKDQTQAVAQAQQNLSREQERKS